MRALRIVASAQLWLGIGEEGGSWWGLPEATRAQVLGLLSSMIANGVLDDGDADDD